MKRIFFILALMITVTSNAQLDSIKNESNHFYEIDISSRNIWRGIDFGNYSPTIVGVFGFTPLKNLEIGAYGITTLSGSNLGYGNTFNVYTSYSKWGLTLTLDDYYFNGDATNIETKYLDWDNTHFLEARLKYELERFHIISSYTLAGGNMYNIRTSQFNNTQGAYIEIGYERDHFGINIGGITSPSALNFHDAAGITNINLKYMNTFEKINDIPFEIGVSYNPNFKYIAPFDLPRIGYGRSSFNFYLSISLI